MTAIVQHLLGIVTVVMVYLLGAVAFGRPTGLVAALGAATCGALLLNEHTVGSEAVFTPLLAGSILAVLLGIRTGKLPFFLAAGLILGCCALTRPIAPAILPLAVGAILVRPATRRSRVLTAGLVCLGFIVIRVPGSSAADLSTASRQRLAAWVSLYSPGYTATIQASTSTTMVRRTRTGECEDPRTGVRTRRNPPRMGGKFRPS